MKMKLFLKNYVTSKNTNEINAYTKKPVNIDKKIIKVVDFDKEKNSKENNSNKKIKIKTF